MQNMPFHYTGWSIWIPNAVRRYENTTEDISWHFNDFGMADVFLGGKTSSANGKTCGK
jgi:hypothetical protein